MVPAQSGGEQEGEQGLRREAGEEQGEQGRAARPRQGGRGCPWHHRWQLLPLVFLCLVIGQFGLGDLRG